MQISYTLHCYQCCILCICMQYTLFLPLHKSNLPLFCFFPKNVNIKNGRRKHGRLINTLFLLTLSEKQKKSIHTKILCGLADKKDIRLRQTKDLPQKNHFFGGWTIKAFGPLTHCIPSVHVYTFMSLFLKWPLQDNPPPPNLAIHATLSPNKC